MTASTKKNYLTYLQREDGAVVDVLSEPCAVVLYEYNSEEKTWEASGVEGSAYVLRYKIEPVCRLRILNRLGTGNYSIDLTSIEKIKEQDPYIMLRNAKTAGHNIFGLQVKDNEQRKALATALKHVIESVDSIRKLNEKEFGGTASASSSSTSKQAAGSQLLSLLASKPPAVPPPTTTESVNVTQLLMRALGGSSANNPQPTADNKKEDKIIYPLFAPSDITGVKRTIRPAASADNTSAVRSAILSLSNDEAFLRLISDRM